MVDEQAQDAAPMTFEQAMAALEAIVQKLEGGQVGLEESIAMYARGARGEDRRRAFGRGCRARARELRLSGGAR
jgi:exodeoxyribonuclease VII small subunit